MSVVTLLTDFGTSDHYVAVMKGVIMQIAPQAGIVDVTHEIQPQDLVRAAYELRQVWEWFPPGAVHVAVVDPGVGSDRRIIAGRYAGRFVVCPDNGLISMVHHELQIEALVVVQNARYFLPGVSATFHGRDILAPVAAHLAAGVDIREFGPPTDRLEVLQIAHPQRASDGRLTGQVLCADRFGNLITNIRVADLGPAPLRQADRHVYLGGNPVGPVRSTYSEVERGQPVALIGSGSHLEISVNCGSAARQFSAAPGTPVEIR